MRHHYPSLFPSLKRARSLMVSVLLASIGTMSLAFDGRAQNLAGDRQALVALYNATDGATWANNDNWLSDEPLDAWYGVSVSDGRVAQLDIEANQLTGPIPPELGDLSRLTWLNLARNQLTGPIPPELGDLYSLTLLYLHGNQLTGPIPRELGDLSSLRTLILARNQLTGPIPPQLGDLSRLTQLEFAFNQLTGPIPPQLGDLSRLMWLDLNDNQLTGPIPPQLGDLSRLRRLYLQRNQLTGTIPPELGDLSSLALLDFQHNQLTGPIPPELGDLSSLERMELNNNQLTGHLPAQLGNLVNLEQLYLSSNHLTGIIPLSVTNLVALKRFWFYKNSGFCAQAASSIRTWLSAIADVRGPNCSSSVTVPTIFVPVVLSAAGQKQSFFTSELTLVNRGAQAASLHYTYTADQGGGSGTATDGLAEGRQTIMPDAIGYLTNLGIPIPGSGNRSGTLRVEVSGSSEVSVVTRTTTTVPDGRAGLAYPGIVENEGFQEAVYLCGLRQNSQDRSNVAFQNMGAPGDGPITLRTTVFSGRADDTSPRVVREMALPPGGFHQYNEVLKELGSPAQGYVKVEKVEGEAPFYAYGVINDNFNSDGSFVFPATESSLVGSSGQTLPVIIETGTFQSELTLTNFSASEKTIDFSFVADAVDSGDDTAEFKLTLKAGEQTILPNLVGWMRQEVVEGIGPGNRAFVGALFATPAEGDMSGVVIGARTGSPDGRGGQFSLFYNGVPYGSASTESAWIYGLQQNAENRSNLAVVNTGEIDDSFSTFKITIYDGSSDSQPRTRNVTLGPRRWTQINGILGNASQGYVQVTKTSGNNPFVTYGVINDGGRPEERSDDGAYLPARQ